MAQSQWTLDTLRACFDGRIAELENRLLAHAAEDALRHSMDQRYAESTLAATKEAITKAERATELRFEAVNEFRQTLTDQATKFMTLAAFNEFQKSAQGYRDSTEQRVNELATRVGMRDAERMGTKNERMDSRAVIALAVAAIVMLVQVGVVIVQLSRGSL